MKKFVFFLLLLTAVFAGGYFFAKEGKIDWKRRPGPRVLTGVETAVGGEEKFFPNPLPLQNRFFTVVIIARNNGACVGKTLSSVFSQNYENYRVIYIDDASDDGSFDLAADLISESGQSMRVAYVNNDEKAGELANLTRAVEECGDEEIIVLLKGDDWLAHEWVLQRINAYYSDPDLWIATGKYCEFPSYDWGQPILYDENCVRKTWVSSPHLKTFYAGLFKKAADLELDGEGELAYMIPMLEMARFHFHSIPEIMTIANGERERELPDLDSQIREMETLSPLTALFSFSSIGDEFQEREIE